MPTTRDLENRTTMAIALAPVSVTSNTTRNSSSLDTAGARYVEYIMFAGGVTDGTYTHTIQESDDDATWTTVATSRRIGTLTALITSVLINTIGVHPTKRYTRVVSVSTGTSTGAHSVGVISIYGDS